VIVTSNRVVIALAVCGIGWCSPATAAVLPWIEGFAGYGGYEMSELSREMDYIEQFYPGVELDHATSGKLWGGALGIIKDDKWGLGVAYQRIDAGSEDIGASGPLCQHA
jgi:hypothetical protein